MFDVGGLDLSDYFKRLECAFSIELDEADLASVYTLGDLFRVIVSKQRASAVEVDDESLWAQLRSITSYEFGVTETDLNKETRFVEDLGA